MSLSRPIRAISFPSLPQGGYLRALLDACDGAAFAQDMHGTILAWSEGAERLYEFTSEEIVGTPASRLIPPDRVHEGAEILHRILRGGRIQLADTERQARDGTRVRVSITASPIRSSRGEVVGAAVFARGQHDADSATESPARPFRAAAARECVVLSKNEMSAVHREVDALRVSEREARRRFDEIEAMVRCAPVGLFALDRRYRFERVNDRMAELDGLPVAQHIGRTLWQVLPDMADRLVQSYRPLLEQNAPVFGLEIHGTTPVDPGSPRDWLCSHVPLTSPSGQVVGIIGSVLDITERKRVDADLRRSEASLARGQAMTHLGSWEWTVGSREMRWSDETYRILGFAPRSVPSTCVQFLQSVHPDDRSRVREALATLEDYRLEHRVRRPDGTVRVVQSELEVTIDPAREIGRIAGTMQDVTEKRRDERIRREVVAMLTHDIKNPLAVILGLAELLRDDPPTDEEERQSFLDRIEVNAKRAADLAVNFIEATCLESEPIRLLRAPVALNDIVDAAAVNLATLARTRGVILETRFGSGIPVLALDARMIDRVVVNLLDNAISFTPTGKRVVVSTEASDGEVRIAVTDEGPGIAPEARASLFKSFRQLGKQRGRNGTSGLGLFIVKTLVEVHGGRVSARWPERGGTVFEIALPVSPPD